MIDNMRAHHSMINFLLPIVMLYHLSSDSTAIIIGGAAGGFVLAVAAVYILHTKGVITLPFTANSAAKASSASGNARPPNR